MEFTLEKGISDEEASRLIGSSVKKSLGKTREWEDKLDDTTQTLRITNDVEEDDPFTARLLTFEVIQIREF